MFTVAEQGIESQKYSPFYYSLPLFSVHMHLIMIEIINRLVKCWDENR